MNAAAGAPRSLTQMLRDWDDAALAALVDARPDLAFPTPTDFSQVASRATTRQSVSDALDELTSAELEVADAVCAHGGTVTAEAVVTELVRDNAAPEPLARAGLATLWRLALLWGDDDGLRPVRALPGLLEDAAPRPEPWQPPSLDELPTQSPAIIDKVAAGSAFEFVRRIDVLVEHLDHHPVRLTRAGGFASRDVRSLAQLLDSTSALTLASLELAQAAGLIGLSARETNEILIPTTRFDVWQSQPLADQWGDLVATWLDRHPRSGSGRFKRLCLDVFGSPADGRVVSTGELRRWLRWHRPRRPQGTDSKAAAMLDEAAALGITGLGALASFAYPASATALGGLLPERVGHVLIQADLTAVAPGPLTAEAARELGALADVESRGGATVYRFSPNSLTRARALGWTVHDILDTLTTRSRTPVPQPLEYLVRELERPERRPPGLTTSPTVRAGIHTPAARAIALDAEPDATARDRLDAASVAAVISALRATPAAADPAAVEPPVATDQFSAVPLETLREAVETRELVWLGLVDAHGKPGERVVRVLTVDAGVVTAEDTNGAGLTVPLHRISAAHIIRAN